MFSMTSGVPLLTLELKDPRYIVKLEVKMLDITLHLNIIILHTKVPKEAKAKRDGVINRQNYNFYQF